MEAITHKDYWNQYFYYDESSPTGLRWKVDRYAGRTGKTRIVAKDDPAGCFSAYKDGGRKCIDVRLNYILYKAHRIIYQMVIGTIPEGYIIDHLDQNPWNNRIDNLEAKPKPKNHRNTKQIATNTSGVTGVHWQAMNNGKQTYAVGCIRLNNSDFSARFGVHHFGLLPAFKMAYEWRKDKVLELNEKFNAGFTELHGVLQESEN